jgi:transposase
MKSASLNFSIFRSNAGQQMECFLSIPEQCRSLENEQSKNSCFPEQCRSFCESNSLVNKPFRSNVGHGFPLFFFRSNVGHSSQVQHYLYAYQSIHKRKGIMPGKIIEMSKIKQVLRLHADGYSNRRIAAELGLNKDTVSHYVKQGDTTPLPVLLKLEDPELEKRFHAGNPAYSDARMQKFLELLPRFKEELSKKHVTRYLVWQEYKQQHPDGYSRSQFFYHLKQNLVVKAIPTAVLTDTYTPGEKLFVDFAGDALSYVDKETGELVKVQVFVATLPFTDYAYATCVPSQKVEDFLHGISQCLEYLGGVPKILVTDNLKSAVVKADKYEPTLNKALEDLGNYYGFVTIPCRPHSPREKALVENQVKLIYRRVYAKLRNSTFFSLWELNQAVDALLLEHNRTRMQMRPYSREEHFYACEKETLGELPKEPYEMRRYADVTVQQNGFVLLGHDKHYYSVPYQLIGRKAKIIYTRSIVRIFVDGEQVALHPRVYGYGYTKIDAHLASNAKAITSRSPEYYKRRAERVSPALEGLIEELFEHTGNSTPPEYYYKTCDMMLRLQKDYPAKAFEQACSICLENGIYSGKKLESILKNIVQSAKERTASNTPAPTPTGHANMRGTGYYQ